MFSASKLLSSRTGGLEVSQIIGCRDEPLQILGGDDRGDPPTPPCDEHGVMLKPRGVDDVGQPSSRVGEAYLAQVLE